MPGNSLSRRNNSLRYAVRRDAIGHAANLLRAGAQAHKQNTRGEAPLHIVAQHGGSDAMITLLLDNGADINVRNSRGETPLMLAVEWGHGRIIALLIQLHANINIVNNNREAALHLAVQKAYDLETIDNVRLVLEAGPDLNMMTVWGKTPFMVALMQEYYHPDVVALLRAHGAHISANNLTGSLNGSQSYNEFSVDHTIVQSTKALAAFYKDKDPKVYFCALWVWLNAQLTSSQPPFFIEPAKRAYDSIAAERYSRSGVTIQDALAYVWMGICDPQAMKEKGIVFCEADIEARKQRLVRHLYECQRGYNLDDKGKDNGLEDKPICFHGKFNKIISTLDGGHDKVNIIFVNEGSLAAKALALVTQAFEKLPEAQQRLFAPQWTNLTGLPKPLWDEYIGEPVTQKLHEEFDVHRELFRLYRSTFRSVIENLEYMGPPPGVLHIQERLKSSASKRKLSIDSDEDGSDLEETPARKRAKM